MSLITLAAAGRRVDAASTRAGEARFPSDCEARVAKEVRDALAALAPNTVIASLACGADILVHEAARELGMARRVVLPFSPEAFRQRSVTDRGESWGPRFDTLMADVEVVQLTDGAPENDDAADRAYSEVTVALVRLAGEGEVGPRGALVIWDGVQHGPADQTAHFRTLTGSVGWSQREILTR
jgi:hypothetical protein